MEKTNPFDRIPRPLLELPIVHRGLYSAPSIPENSLKAFEAARRVGAPVELDVQLLADGTPVVFHDADLQRMTGCPGKIGRQDRQSLRRFRLQETEEPIPLLAEVLDLLGGRIALLIEVKSVRLRVGRLEQAVLTALKPYDGEFALQSFNPITLRWFRLHAPSLCRGQLSGGRLGIPFAHATCPDFVAYRLDSLPHPAVSRARQEGLPALAWTVRTSAQEQKARQETDNYIFTPSATFDPYACRKTLSSF